MSEVYTEHDPMIQLAPWPIELEKVVKELLYLPGWRIYLSLPDYDRGQGCKGLTLMIMPNKQDAYNLDKHANTTFLYPVPAAAYNRDSWEEWVWSCIEETEAHERAENFKFITWDGKERRPFKPIHADGWEPGFIRKVVSEELADVPNAGRLVLFPCALCKHEHKGKMGEAFRVAQDRGCIEPECGCAT